MKFLRSILLFLAVCLFISGGPVHAERVKLVAGEWAPYVSEDLPDGGFAAEVIIYAFLAAGIETDLEFTPWQQCEELVRAGKVFGAFPHKRTPERLRFARFSEPIAMSKGVFFYMKENISDLQFSALEDLAKYTIGGARGHFYESEFKRAGLTVEYASEAAISFKKLYIGLVDLVPENELVGWGLLQKFYPDELYKFGASRKSYNESSLHLMVSKQYPDSRNLLNRFNEGLKVIQDKGIYQRLLKKYVRNVKIKIPKSPY
jgi:polar amino acid transport system substrate-binding protein